MQIEKSKSEVTDGTDNVPDNIPDNIPDLNALAQSVKKLSNHGKLTKIRGFGGVLGG